MACNINTDELGGNEQNRSLRSDSDSDSDGNDDNVHENKGRINVSCENYDWGQNAITLVPYITGLVLGPVQ
jgi:hypothetical protein